MSHLRFMRSTLTGLSRSWWIGNWLVKSWLMHTWPRADADSCQPELPGNWFFRTPLLRWRSSWLRCRRLIQGDPLAPADFDFTTAGFRVLGRVGQIWPHHLLHYRCAFVKAKDRLNLWIDHLLLQTLSRPGYPKSSVLLAKEAGWRLRPTVNAREILNQLLNYYWEGLREPIPFFPQSAYVFAERRRQGKNDEEALNAARRTWEGDRHSRPEAEDPYYDLNWGKVDALDERFKELAVAIFGPLLEHEEKLEL